VNRDASLSCRAAASDASDRHARVAPGGWSGNAVRQHAAHGARRVRRSLRHNRFGRDRQQLQIRLWVRQAAHRNSRADRASWCADRQAPRRRTPRLPGYWPCMRAQHGVRHGVDAAPPSRPRRRACPSMPERYSATRHRVSRARPAALPATRSHLSSNSGHASPPALPGGRYHPTNSATLRQICAGPRSHRHHGVGQRK
jgi:hypothetical protein